MKFPPLFLAAAALAPSLSTGAVILSENFGSTNVNPTATTFTTQESWSYSDSAGTTVTGDESRLFSPGGAGSQETTHGWISALNGAQTFQQIQASKTFVGLPTLEIGQTYQFTLTFYASAQTSVAANDVNAYVQFTSAGNALQDFAGANGGTATNFVAQTLGDSNAATDVINANFVAQGGAGGYNAPRQYTATWTSSDIANGENYSLALGRGTNVAAASYVFFDNVSLDVSVVPEPSMALLGGLGVLGLLRRRR